jgi:hypothetical protein
MNYMSQLLQRHPSAILLVVQLLGMLLYPFIETGEDALSIMH